jgi:chaperonin GroES
MMTQPVAVTPDTEADELYENPEAEGQDEKPKGDAWLIANAAEINLASMIDATHLAQIGTKVVEEYKIDLESRKASGWEARHASALKQAMQVKEVKNYPWENASNVKFPLTTVAAIQFNARAYPAIVDGAAVVKGKVLGKPDEGKRARADRIGRHMSYQLLDEMEEWEEGTDELLVILPVTGTVFRKTYFDPAMGRNCSELITADKLVVNYWAKASPERMTQVCEYYPREVASKTRSGLWMQQDIGRPQDANNDDDAPHKFLEQHRLLDLDEDGFPEPYIVTVHLETEKVVRIYARYDVDGIKANDKGEVFSITPVRYFTRYRFMPPMDGSYYGVGFGTLLDPLNETINSTLNQMMDAGHLVNTQSGFIGDGISMKSGKKGFAPGELKRVVNSSGGALRDNIVMTDFKGPSPVLFQLLGMLVDVSKDITATKDILTGETGQSNTPVGTTLAMIEQGLKVFSAIYKRIHRSLKLELQCLFRLNRLYLEPEVYFNFQDEEGQVGLDDYQQADVGVIPVSDPTVVTDMQRIGRAQYLGTFRGMGLDDMEINKRMLEAGGIQDIQGLLPKGPPPPSPEQIKAQSEAENNKRKLDQKDIELTHEGALTDSQISINMADAQNKMTEALLKAPQFQLLIEQFLDKRLADMTQGAPDGQSPPVQQGELGGMGQPPADQGLPPVPQGPADGPGSPVDGGNIDGAQAAGEGAPPGGVVGPGLG